jgi:predicted nucleic acid-binding protein
VRAFFDTSVLVGFASEDHPTHRASYECVTRNTRNAAISVHSLAETYSTLTGMRGARRFSPDEAILFLEGFESWFEVIELGTSEYLSTIEACGSLGITGAAVYDALIGKCAIKAGASVLYTWNVKDFVRLGPEVAGLVRTP